MESIELWTERQRDSRLGLGRGDGVLHYGTWRLGCGGLRFWTREVAVAA